MQLSPCDLGDFCHLVKIFSKFNKIGFPLGQEMYFVPNTIDQRIATSRNRITNVNKMRDRQKIWLDKVNIIQSYSIAALDIPIKMKQGIDKETKRNDW